MRVCLVGLAAGGHSGVPRYAAALTRALDRVSPEFPDVSLSLLTTPDGAREARVGRIRADLVGGPFANRSAGPGRILTEQLHARRADADLLHFFDLTGPLLAPRRRFVTTIHDAAARHGFERARVAHKRFLQPWAIRHAAATIAVSRFARDEAVRMFSADPRRIHVIHSGPGLGVANGSAATARSGPPLLLYVGNLAAHKNLDFLIEAFGESGAEGRLVLVGRRGERFEEVRRAADASPARDRIEIRRDASDAEVEALYRSAAMLLLPSRYEGFGFTALEAMARDCPVLASDIPALREVSGDGAMLLPPGDRGAWADAMRRLLRDEGEAEELRRRGRATVARYSWAQTARSLCGVFLSLGEQAA